MALTGKQEAFCQAYVELNHSSDAYRRSYNASKMKAETIHRSACEVLKNRNVAARIEELRNVVLKRHNLTVDDIIEELEEARQLAITSQTPQAAASIAASMGKAKILGFLTDKVEHTGENGSPINMTLNVKFKSAGRD
jgi:phage terminase small subunit